jgi:hypothetical protein
MKSPVSGMMQIGENARGSTNTTWNGLLIFITLDGSVSGNSGLKQDGGFGKIGFDGRRM